MAETFLKDSQTASNNFRLKTETWDGVDKPKFLYYIKFVKSNNTSGGTDYTKSIGILAKHIDRPGFKLDTETLNQYNKKRIVQKRIEYDPVSVTFHDTVDNKVAHMVEDYIRFYYGDPRNKSAIDWKWDQYANEMSMGQGGDWGFIPPKDTSFANYFSHIEFYYLYGGRYTQYDIINPKIESYTPSDMEYSDSVGAEIQVRFIHEGIVYQGNNKTLSGSLAEEMGISMSGVNDIQGSTSSFMSPAYQSDPQISNVIDPSGNYSGSVPTPSVANDRSAALMGADTSFGNVVNNILSLPGKITNNIAQSIVDSLK